MQKCVAQFFFFFLLCDMDGLRLNQSINFWLFVLVDFVVACSVTVVCSDTDGKICSDGLLGVLLV